VPIIVDHRKSDAMREILDLSALTMNESKKRFTRKETNKLKESVFAHVNASTLTQTGF
jgi:hypothetical protein